MTQKLNLLIFSGEYDKALAAFILANTARGMDIDVSMFFAFWGLLLLRKKDGDSKPVENKDLLKKMMGRITPQNADQLPLSKMNFSGLGKLMLEEMMENADTPKLSNFLKEAQEKGVNFYGCKLSTEVMGFDKTELLPDTKIITAEEYLQDALQADLQLFI